LKGNHDQASNAVGDHALAALDPVATIVDTQRVISIGDFDLWCMSFGPDMVAELKRLADEEVTSDHPVALCMHLGIAGPGTPPWLKASGISLEDLEQAMARSGCAVCFAGDWHRHERYLNDTAIQVGTLCPAGFDDAGLDGYGRVVLWEPGVGVQAAVEIPGPRFLKVTSLESIDLGVTPPPYVQLICSPAKLAVVEELLTMALKGGAIAGYKLVLDDAEQVAQARTAAEGARSARNLDEALERYVAAMPLNEDVDREELLAGCRALLGLRRKEPEGKETES
jgi:hypothetical protein